jgi:pyruvate/2-oxoglutarate dehydrogenase complex dihydrolipoamide acyltransferase (E2) component
VGHTKSYEQVLLRLDVDDENAKTKTSRKELLARHPLMGRSATVRITEVARWHAVGEILEVWDKQATRQPAPASAAAAMAKTSASKRSAQTNPHRGLTTGEAARASAALALENATKLKAQRRIDRVSLIALFGVIVGVLGLAFAVALAWLERAKEKRGGV